MKIVLRVVAVLVLTHLYTLLIYRWPPLAHIADRVIDGELGQRAYVWLMSLFGWEGAENGETLLLIFFVLIALAAACLTVLIASRLILAPLCRRHVQGQANR
ncbi:hypothetical protein SAMN06295900_10786 [Trinickia caryophylli]|uniref:Uncharacterized protein n=1 Tax=Trinickia caryophylli TaxID=28094 RepID=A0A1X7F3S8_TRICW|nr:hypothetical protein C0Z17_20080 [Trinickia caryophylli]SMF44918.1 hypothetical protein SAMN06295900_10786 [Trinickia caryophylli]